MRFAREDRDGLFRHRTAVSWANEAIARAVGREPADVWAENLVPADAMPCTNATGKHYDRGDCPASVAGARRMIELDAVGAREGRTRPVPERVDRLGDGCGRQGDFQRRPEQTEQLGAAPARPDEAWPLPGRAKQPDSVHPRRSSPEPDGRLNGVGFSTFAEQTAHGARVFGAWGLPLAPGYEPATVKLAPGGVVEARSGNHSFGQRLETTLAQVASEQLGIGVDRIRAPMGDAGETPCSAGACDSQGMVMAG